MRPLALVGVLLIATGLLALVYQGITYTSRETLIDIGPLHATADRQKTLTLPPVLGIACPNVLFPYARETIADAVIRAGFPPVHLAPINFEALYQQQQLAQMQQPVPAVTN